MTLLPPLAAAAPAGSPLLSPRFSRAPGTGPTQAEVLAEPAVLHPSLWRARSGGAGAQNAALPSGFAALDAELPGGGWPVRTLTELLLAQPGMGEIRLLAPLLAPLARAGRSVLLFAPPAELNAVALAELGWQPSQCIVVRAAASAPSRRHRSQRQLPGAELCWAIEQALRSGQAGAVLAWPGAVARPEALRRWQLAAQAHEGPAFLLREAAAGGQSSPASLRVQLQIAGPDELAIHIVKRRGPAMVEPLALALPPVLSERAHARSQALQAQAAASPPDAGGTGAGLGQSGPFQPVKPLPPAAPSFLS